MSATDSHRHFGAFRLDPANAQLWRGQEKISLRPKTFDVLRYLVDHPDQLVTKAMLLDAVWPGVSVSDSMPATCVVELRRALGDDAKTPKFIETVHRRGYRFIAQVTAGATTSAQPVAEPRTKPPETANGPLLLLVGREEELAQLKRWYARALAGERLVVFVAGEAGIGKTSFVAAFLDSIAEPGNSRIGRGQCTEQYGAGEPYMPVLEALTRLGRERGGSEIIALLTQFAPTWLAQMPGLLTREERVRLQGESQGITQQRMLREMTQALEAIAAESPLVLLLEDLHWSDFSTLALISAIARRSEPARLLIIGTYRPVEILARDHPLRTIKQELQLHRYCEELRLRLLSTTEVQDYLARRLTSDAPRQFDTLAPVIHARTDGNPLFMVNMVDYLLLDTGLRLSSREVSEAELAEQLRAHRLDSLSSIRHMIEYNLERLKPEEQAVLEGASVAGAEFSAASVAAAVERPQNEVEACCARLSRQEQFVTALGPITWPDGTVAAGFRFHHALYQEVLYSRLPAGLQVQLHQRIAEREEAGFGERVEEVATELAFHYGRAHDRNKAIQYFSRAGQRAVMRGAMIEAERHYVDALALLRELPQSQERDHRELQIQVALGSTLIVIQGWASSETERAYTRARELCERLSESPNHFSTLFGIYATYLVRGEVNSAHALAEQLMRRADNTEDPALKLYARIALGVALYFMGQFVPALKHLETAIAIYDPGRHQQLMLSFGFDAGVWSLCYTAATLWHLGYADQALRRADEALALAGKLSHPLNLAQAELWMSILRQFRREERQVLETTDRLINRSAEYGITDWLDWAGCLRGWAAVLQGRFEEGIAQTLSSQAALEARGARIWRPYFLFLLAEAYLNANLIDDGLGAVEDGLATVVKYEEREHEAHLYLLRGKLRLRQDSPEIGEARHCIERAIEIARQRNEKSLELTATVSLARLLIKQGNPDEARTRLSESYNWFTEGFQTVALREARLLLDELAEK
jgi:DNA-binding winged helix-turn-helix (wHTH) protein/tetratricopeptide (TPR) repeat protein